ncbi:RipA family octameric membrane protein [Blastococcus sp. SYSU DS0539]
MADEKRPRGGYFRTAKPVPVEEVAAYLWNPGVGTESYAQHREKYQAAVLEQYRLYVEMADRISARRALANTFFLSLNTAVLVLIGVFWRKPPEAAVLLLALPLAFLLALCLAWFWLVRSYRQLNAGKFVVIAALEQRLPASPWQGEWHALGRGDDRAKYWPLTHVEPWVPGIYAGAYVAGFVTALIATLVTES